MSHLVETLLGQWYRTDYNNLGMNLGSVFTGILYEILMYRQTLTTAKKKKELQTEVYLFSNLPYATYISPLGFI